MSDSTESLIEKIEVAAEHVADATKAEFEKVESEIKAEIEAVIHPHIDAVTPAVAPNPQVASQFPAPKPGAKNNPAPQTLNGHGQSRYKDPAGLVIDWFDTHPRPTE